MKSAMEHEARMKTNPPNDDKAAEAPAAKKLHAPSWTNPLTLLGLLLVGSSLVLLLTFWLFQTISPQAGNNQYLNIVGLLILPGVLVNGLILCPVGIALRRWRQRRGLVGRISSKQAIIFLAVTFFLILPVLGVGGYQGYEFSDSAEFCGTVCHNMAPQYAGYQRSPHARVTCAGCHIGSGAAPFVKAKLNGSIQMFHTFLNTYPKPVPPAITELRPARETCEQCHWPSQFFGSDLRKIAHYSPDEHNTRHNYEILVKVGGANLATGQSEGIHMHMLDHVTYVSDDAKLEHIPWVSYKNQDGTTTIYRSDGKPASDPAPQGKPRLLDCIDCHNLAGHEFASPERAVNHGLLIGRLDPSLPYIKREAVRALAGDYKTRDEGVAAVRASLENFYTKTYPEVWSKRHEDVLKAIDATCEMYRANFFPEFKVDWRTYPNHLGHMESAGCFRCHDGLHVADNGRRITSDCNTCHTFLYRQSDDPSMIHEQKFEHPLKIHDWWVGLGPHEKMLCTDCHDGGVGALGWEKTTTGYTCGTCHPSGRWLQMRETVHQRAAAASQPSTPGAAEPTPSGR